MYLIDQIKNEAAEALRQAIGPAAGPDFQVAFEYPEDPANGDLAFPCFQLAKALKTAPPKIAADLAEKINDMDLSASSSTVALAKVGALAKAEAKGPYLNFYLDAAQLVAAITAGGAASGSPERAQLLVSTSGVEAATGPAVMAATPAVTAHPEKIMVEYISPNNNKPLHLGHVRNGLIGAAVSGLLESQGHRVIRSLLLNDRGLAIAKTMVAYAKWGEGRTPESHGMKGDHFVAEYYVLFEKKMKEGIPGLEEEAHEVIRKWEAGDEATRLLWQTMNDWCERGQHETYKSLGFRFDVEYKESEIYREGKEIVEAGLKSGVFVKDETGAVVARLEKHGLPDKVVLRADGTSLYITQDLCLAKRRFEEHGLDRLIYVVGNEQNLQFRQLFKILELLGFPWAKSLRHLSYGYVSLPEGRMKSREGTVVDADDLLAALEADAAMEIKQRHATIPDDELCRRARSVALAAVKFHFLEADVASDTVYDPRASLSFTGKTGPYLQYMHARIRSILRKSAAEPQPPAYRGRNVAAEEKALALMVAKWPEAVREAAQSLRPSLVAQHLYDTAKVFASFYENVQVLAASEEDRAARLAIVSAVALVLKEGLNLLGIAAPEEM